MIIVKDGTNIAWYQESSKLSQDGWRPRTFRGKFPLQLLARALFNQLADLSLKISGILNCFME